MAKSKEEIVQSLEKHDVELGDFYEGAQFLTDVIDECDLNISFDAISDQSEHFIICTYYSSKLQKSVILDWSVENSFDSNEALADTILEYEKEAEELEAKIS